MNLISEGNRVRNFDRASRLMQFEQIHYASQKDAFNRGDYVVYSDGTETVGLKIHGNSLHVQGYNGDNLSNVGNELVSRAKALNMNNIMFSTPLKNSPLIKVLNNSGYFPKIVGFKNNEYIWSYNL